MTKSKVLFTVFAVGSAAGDRMRDDDTDQHMHCVDCPEYVALSAKDKEEALWSKIVSDEYTKGFTERECDSFMQWATSDACHCNGEVKFGYDGHWTPYHKVTGSLTCGDEAIFGSFSTSLLHKKRCMCKDDFPVRWEGLLEREMQGNQARCNNGTMPMFFDRFSDENPYNNKKGIHTGGAVATARVVPTGNHQFTGMFADGFEHGLVRLSIVADWSQPCKGGTDFNFKGCLKPSMALKMLRDGDFSSNVVAQVNLGDGVGWHFNFFDYAHANWLPLPTGLGALLVTHLFSYAAEEDEIAGVGIEEVSSQGSQAHQSKSDIKAPKLVYFVPNKDLSFSDEEHDPRSDFMEIPAGTALFDIMTITDGDDMCFNYFANKPFLWDELGHLCQTVKLGTVVSTSRFVASDWGDRRLFFQHERLKTKNGKWARKSCANKHSGMPLPFDNAFRMASEPDKTCTHECGPDMVETGDVCPFSELEERADTVV